MKPKLTFNDNVLHALLEQGGLSIEEVIHRTAYFMELVQLRYEYIQHDSIDGDTAEMTRIRKWHQKIINKHTEALSIYEWLNNRKYEAKNAMHKNYYTVNQDELLAELRRLVSNWDEDE